MVDIDVKATLTIDNALFDNFIRTTTREAGRRWARNVRDRAIDLAPEGEGPRDTSQMTDGWLSRWGAQNAQRGGRLKRSHRLNVGRSIGLSWFGGVENTAPHAAYVFFGTSNVGGNPLVFPAPPSGPARVVTPSVSGQRANPWLLEAALDAVLADPTISGEQVGASTLNRLRSQRRASGQVGRATN